MEPKTTKSATKADSTPEKEQGSQVPKAPHVYTAINQVQAALAEQGIAKDRRNAGQGFQYRGIDEVFNALARQLADAGLVIIPRCINRETREASTKTGGSLLYVTVQMEYDFVAVLDGSTHTACMFGEAMDSGDKATNKAMSAAYKYMAFQAFCIPTEGDKDADAVTHTEVKSHGVMPPAQQAPPVQQPPANNVNGSLFTGELQADIQSAMVRLSTAGTSENYFDISRQFPTELRKTPAYQEEIKKLFVLKFPAEKFPA